jgi:hypothetical protein
MYPLLSVSMQQALPGFALFHVPHSPGPRAGRQILHFIIFLWEYGEGMRTFRWIA